MEEDIKILEEKIEFWKKDPRIMIEEENFRVLQAMKNIIGVCKEMNETLTLLKQRVGNIDNHIPRID